MTTTFRKTLQEVLNHRAKDLEARVTDEGGAMSPLEIGKAVEAEVRELSPIELALEMAEAEDRLLNNED